MVTAIFLAIENHIPVNPQGEDTSTDHSVPMLLLFIAVVGISFWFTDHQLTASSRFLRADDFVGSDNRTADRVENVRRVSTPFRIGLGLFGLACLVLLPPKRKQQSAGAVLIFITLFAGFLGASCIWSIHPFLTFQKFASMCFFGLAAVGLARRLSLDELAIVFSSICVVLLFVGVLAEIGLGNFKPQVPGYRFAGTGHPNTLACYGAVCCLSAAVYSRKSAGINVWTVLVFAIGVVTLLITKSRTSLAAVVIALLATRFITLKPSYRLFMVSTVMLLVVVAGMVLGLTRGDALSKLGHALAMGRTQDVGTLTGRLPLWEEVAGSIKERPLLGHGYLAYWNKEQIEYLSDSFGWEIPHGHNMYLDVMIDGGVFGLALFLAILVSGLVVSLRNYRQFRKFGVAFVFGMIVFALVHGVGESLVKLHTFVGFMIVTSLIGLGSLAPNDNEVAN